MPDVEHDMVHMEPVVNLPSVEAQVPRLWIRRVPEHVEQGVCVPVSARQDIEDLEDPYHEARTVKPDPWMLAAVDIRDSLQLQGKVANMLPGVWVR